MNEKSTKIDIQYDRFTKIIEILHGHEFGDNLNLIAMVWGSTLLSICEKESDLEKIEPIGSSEFQKRVKIVMPNLIKMRFGSGKD